MVSEKFSGLSRVSMQRLVHQALSEELKSHIHALSLDLKAP
ncbi:BolA/IbaG family iron-sulfur metabolism protein [Sneathiella glossodoripedis]